MILGFYKEPDKGVVINLEVAIATDKKILIGQDIL